MLFSFWNGPQQDKCSSLEEDEAFMLKPVVLNQGTSQTAKYSFACGVWAFAF